MDILNKGIVKTTGLLLTAMLLGACATPEQQAQERAQTAANNRAAMSASIPEGWKQLDGNEIRTTLAGNTQSGISTRSGSPYRVYFHPDGKMEGRAGESLQHSDTGSWSVEGDQHCTQWSRWADSQMNCYWLFTNAAGELRSYRDKWHNGPFARVEAGRRL